MDQLEELENTFLELYSSAEKLNSEGRNKSTLILLSKALFALLDYIIFKEYKKIPLNHSDRFRILESRQPLLYALVNKVWSKYTDTYSKPADAEAILMLKNAIREVTFHHETISEKIKKAVK